MILYEQFLSLRDSNLDPISQELQLTEQPLYVVAYGVSRGPCTKQSTIKMKAIQLLIRVLQINTDEQTEKNSDMIKTFSGKDGRTDNLPQMCYDK